MKKIAMLVVAGMFSVSAAAYACDGMKDHAKSGKTAETAKKDSKKTDGKS